jgi:hypothetical protein
MSRAAAIALGLAAILPGCTTTLGKLPVVAHDSDVVGTKMLRPGATGRSCGTEILGLFVGPPPDLAAAVQQVLDLDHEGNVVLDAVVTRFDVILLLVNRRCLEVRGDLARVTPSVVIPGGHDHGAAHGHGQTH